MYDEKFESNILAIGRTDCGKSTFALAINNIFGKLTKAEWVSQITLSKQREVQIQSNFDCLLSFNYPENVKELDTDFAEENIYGENEKMDGVSGLADKSNAFVSFLTVS